MTEPEFDPAAHQAAMETALGLTIDPAWRAGVVANIAAVKRAADLVMGLELGDHVDPAPVFEAGA